MNDTNTKTTPTPEQNFFMGNISDADMLKYLVREIGKTREELNTEIRERFWCNADFQTFLAKPM